MALLPHLYRAHTHTLTLSHSITFSHTLSLSHFRSYTHTLSVSHTLSHSHSHSLRQGLATCARRERDLGDVPPSPLPLSSEYGTHKTVMATYKTVMATYKTVMGLATCARRERDLGDVAPSPLPLSSEYIYLSISIYISISIYLSIYRGSQPVRGASATLVTLLPRYSPRATTSTSCRTGVPRSSEPASP